MTLTELMDAWEIATLVVTNQHRRAYSRATGMPKPKALTQWAILKERLEERGIEDPYYYFEGCCKWWHETRETRHPKASVSPQPAMLKKASWLDGFCRQPYRRGFLAPWQVAVQGAEGDIDNQIRHLRICEEVEQWPMREAFKVRTLSWGFAGVISDRLFESHRYINEAMLERRRSAIRILTAFRKRGDLTRYLHTQLPEIQTW